jgi:hypothetical protein
MLVPGSHTVQWVLRLSAAIAVSTFLAACSSPPPVLQRWAGLQIATTNLRRADGGASFYFSEDGTVDVHPPGSDAPRVRWRVREEWLEIDTKNDARFETRLRALTVSKEQIVAQTPSGEKTVWQADAVKVVIRPVRPSPPGVYVH